MKEKYNSCFYSKAHEELIAELRKNDALKSVDVIDYGQFTSDLIKGYKYDYGSWPVVISNERVEHFTVFFNKFKSICYKAILNFFDSKDSFGDYLDCPSFLFDFLDEVSTNLNEYVFRYDIAYSSDEFKILEVNTGTNVGGWQLDLLSGNYINLLRSNDFSKNWNVKKEYILENVFGMVIKSVRSLKNQSSEQNVVCVIEDEHQHDDVQYIRAELSKIFARVKLGLNFSGDLIWCGNLDELYIDGQDLVYINGRKVAAVMVHYVGLESSIQSAMMRLTKSYLKGNIVFPDSPFHNLLGNKNILSLLYEAIDKDIFDSKEVKLINKHVPWTHRLGGEYLYKNKIAYNATDFIKDNKENLVLKKSMSMKGQDVYVGRFMNESDWLAVVAEHSLDKSWLIQEYCKPDQAIMCDKSGWLGAYDFIWGIFDIDCRYSGAFIRGSRGSCGNGVINSASGAIEFSVFEEEKLKMVMSI